MDLGLEMTCRQRLALKDKSFLPLQTLSFSTFLHLLDEEIPFPPFVGVIFLWFLDTTRAWFSPLRPCLGVVNG